jgi:hypothetical protein
VARIARYAEPCAVLAPNSSINGVATSP